MNSSKLTFSCSYIDAQEVKYELETFRHNASHPEILKIKRIDEKRLPKDVLLIGIKDGIEENFNCFIFKHPENKIVLSRENIAEIAGGAEIAESPEYLKYMPRVYDGFKHKEEHDRLYGKTAMNFLAFIKGKEYTNQDCFRRIKHWVSEGSDFSGFQDDPTGANFCIAGQPIPLDAHFVLIFKIGDQLIAKVSFYNCFCRNILLAENYTEPFSTDGLICDWRNETEYRLNEYIAKKVMESVDR